MYWYNPVGCVKLINYDKLCNAATAVQSGLIDFVERGARHTYSNIRAVWSIVLYIDSGSIGTIGTISTV